jgi:ornithine carbamoyltransferase
MQKKDFISIHDLRVEEIQEILDLSKDMKADPDKYRESLKGKTLAMIFQKPSTRTRVSFEVGIYQLGGLGLYLGANDLQIGRGETVSDTARVLSRYVDGIMARTFENEIVVELARYATVPVINGLTDLLHPCQAIADYFTLLERRGRLKGLKIAYVGDGNNVAHSLMFGATKVGMDIALATPKDYAPDKHIVKLAQQDAKTFGTKIEIFNDPEKAVKNADVIYTDVWASMGQEAEHKKRVKAFKGYQVTEKLMAKANPEAVFMHCLPAHRGEEVAAEVMDGPQSVVFDEAENRLHTQKAIMYLLMKQYRER